MALSAGARLGPYEILSALGAGGMGEVYKARDSRLDRTVAIKVLPAHVASDPDLRQRFDREARAVAALNHPHICTLHDIGNQDGVDFLVMEYLEGETLAERLASGSGRHQAPGAGLQAPRKSTAPRRSADDRDSDCERVGQGPSRGHHAPGSQTRQHFSDEERREAPGFRAGEKRRFGSRSG